MCKETSCHLQATYILPPSGRAHVVCSVEYFLLFNIQFNGLDEHLHVILDRRVADPPHQGVRIAGLPFWGTAVDRGCTGAGTLF
jgi:hypothetical protein